MAYLIAAQYGNDAFKGMLDDPQNREPRIRHFFHQLALKLKKSVSVWPLEKFLFGSRVQKIKLGRSNSLQWRPALLPL